MDECTRGRFDARSNMLLPCPPLYANLISKFIPKHSNRKQSWIVLRLREFSLKLKLYLFIHLFMYLLRNNQEVKWRIRHQNLEWLFVVCSRIRLFFFLCNWYIHFESFLSDLKWKVVLVNCSVFSLPFHCVEFSLEILLLLNLN